MKNYTIDNNNIYISLDDRDLFNYSDGDDIENYLLNIVLNAGDLSTGSEELYTAIKDWPSLYHLSPQRADLLRPFSQNLPGKKILEIGCGCGAITRYLVEQGAIVTALEGSYRRARITSARCRDLDKLTVVCENLFVFDTEERFDIITLIGVLEYSNLFIKGHNPSLEILKRAQKLLKPDGILIIAIENKLGLKYWAGAPEDHLGKSYMGIEGQYSILTPITFGKKELIDLLDNAGYKRTDFLYPFPDYKFANTILTSKAFRNNEFNLANFLFDKLNYIQDDLPSGNTFSVSLAAEGLIKNNLMDAFSNSFLVIATNDNGFQYIPDNALLYTYSTLRKKQYCKENSFLVNKAGTITVKKNKLYKNTSPEPDNINNRLTNEKYIPGHLLSNSLLRIVYKSDWLMEDLVNWADIYYRIIKQYAFEQDDSLWMEGKHFDLTPFNIIITTKNAGHKAFDLEWIADDSLPFYFIFFRGILNSLLRVGTFKPIHPQESPVQTVIELTTLLTRRFIPFSEDQLKHCIDKENSFLQAVNLGTTPVLKDKEIKVQETPLPIQYIYPLLVPLHQVYTQVFWQANDAVYTEEYSIMQVTNLEEKPVKLYFSVKNNMAVTNLRIDLANEIGVMYLHSISAKDNRKKTLLYWKAGQKNNFNYINLLVFKSSIYPDRQLCLFIGNDPIIDVSVRLKEAKQANDLKIQIIVSKLSDIDWKTEIEFINKYYSLNVDDKNYEKGKNKI